MKTRIMAFSFASLLALAVGGSAWSCGCVRTVCHTAKPVCHTHVVKVVKPVSTCGCHSGSLMFW